MAQPAPYNPAHEFLTDEGANPNFPGSELDIEFNALNATIDEILTNLALIQRDDGALANESVTGDALAIGVVDRRHLTAAIRSANLSDVTLWGSGTVYAVSDIVSQSNSFYRCLVAHTAGVFATDLAAGKWLVIAEIPTTVLGSNLTDIDAISFGQGDIIYFNGANVVKLTAGTSGQFLKTQGTADNPVWATISGGGDMLAANNLSDVANAATARTNLGLAIGTNVQAFDATLASLAALGTVADRLAYTTGVDTWAETALTAAGRALIDDASAAAQRTTLGLVIGTDVQAQDAELAALAGLTSAADKLPYFTGVGTAATADFTAAGRALVDDANAAAQRATLGVVIGTNVQAFDETLASLAALGTAADKLAYTTAIDTWEETALTAAGRALIDDADAAAQRTTLGLGALAVLATVGTAQIDNAAVTFAKIQNLNSDRLLGRDAAGAGATVEIALSSGLEFTGSDAVRVTAAARTGAVTFTFDGGGSAIAANSKGDVRVPWAGTITKVTLLADQTGSIVIDLWKDTYANYPPTVADTITASAKPTLSAAQKYEDATLTGWTTAVSAGDTLRANVDSASTVTRVVLILEIERS